jgi:HSP20 family protein
MFASLIRGSADPFGDLDWFQRQVEQTLGGRAWPSSIRAAGRGAFPPINMGTRADAVEIYAFAPGLDPSRIEVSVDRGLLTIAGERAPELPPENDKVNVYAAERFSGPFRRVVSLPDDADASRVEAKYRDGVLRISVPKRESAKPRRVEVQGAN